MKKDAIVRLIPLGDQARAIGALLVAALFLFQESLAFAQPPMPASSSAGQAQSLAPEQLDSLVAPIALYPDSLLSQVLVASTYPLEIVQADRWVKQNSGLQGKNLTDAAAKQPWDPSIQALVLFPVVLAQMDQNIGWTTDLGNAFLGQESAVFDAVQRMRQKAEQSGKLKSTPQQAVTTASANNATYIEIQPTDPQVIYVPQYEPVAVWGPPAYYPYPAIAYPYGGALAAGIVSFGAGVAIGTLVSGGGGWGWGCGWGSHAVIVNNNFIRNNHFNRVNVANGNQWRHSPDHRRAVPYNNAGVAGRFKPGAVNNLPNRPNPIQTQQRLGQAERRAGQGQWTGRAPGQVGPGNAGHGMAGRPGQVNPGQRPALNPAVRPPANTGSANRVVPNNMGNKIGGRQIAPGNMGGAFGGMNAGGGRAHMNSNRGFSSTGGFNRGGGGFNRGGGGSHRGGGRRR